MAITHYSDGDNSFRIEYDGGSSLAGLRSEFNTRLASLGWSLYDEDIGGTGDLDCWRSLNADNTTYTYIVLDWSTSGYLLLKLYESWNNVTHTGTNLAQVGKSDAAQTRAATDYGQVIDLSAGGRLYCCATARWLVIYSYADSAYGDDWHGGFTGVFEIERTVDGDTAGAGYPCSFWMSSSYLNDHTLASSTGLYILSLPRLFDGSTGDSASNRAIFMAPGVNLRFGPGQNFTSAQSYPMILGTDSFGNNSSSPIYIGFGDQANSPERHGQVFGLSVLSAGNWRDTAQLGYNSSFMYDENGDTLDCWTIMASQGNIPMCLPK